MGGDILDPHDQFRIPVNRLTIASLSLGLSEQFGHLETEPRKLQTVGASFAHTYDEAATFEPANRPR
jgi:hypothetical protein